ncbi:MULTISPECIES: FAD-dependent monooxygenase [unclassified Janthinobacterium]|uniref:FAD-dependent monooxygenase n=1 Tax=unclassified Janthinobacterium TaxID=2610881 RepID=UPI00161AD9F8|nr:MULTISPECIES: FAD-dependent monooxygenase [unclassified Janthinobacterium]MBB5371263.1 2-polyprenyl-6-methoxyphenol hydroxylase-like FAD-dependent oxidoreductase [Janthinobacterium sp. K2C7]MBB5384069.1 2-polyprenyl-6-methoxyphenol hydroxylase-like FAD-dependent oxidoreductase [Janthinobacterium sp. K2Li3]MBB5389471.1 2-polyprenyl-6-methoxyphenol hydroxylase-like FAD-dependent oxidoreductase [Janthinobacterium sp. K2E3]
MTTNSPHVTIIGAGIGGLCLAQGLQQAGIAFDVYEKDAANDSRRQGYRLRLDQTGLAALAACLPPQLNALLQQCGAPPSPGVGMIDAQLSTLKDKGLQDWQQDGQPDLRINRLSLREILLAGISEHVHFGKAFDRYRERADGKVDVYFTDGSGVLTDMLVGADGVHSAVMGWRFPGVRPEESGDVCIYGTTAMAAAAHRVAPELQSDTSVLFEPGLAMVIDAMPSQPNMPPGLALTDIPDYLYWAMIGKRERFVGMEQDLQGCIAGITASWSPALQALFELADPGAITVAPIRHARPVPAWKTSAITVLGDAIHAMSPASGLGANTALADAAALLQALLDVAHGHSGLLPAIARYEHELRLRGNAAVAASRRGSIQLLGSEENPMQALVD